MPIRNAYLAVIASIGLVVFCSGTIAQTVEENRHAGELKACGQLAEAERKPCEDKTRAKIKAEHTARIEAESRRRQGR